MASETGDDATLGLISTAYNATTDSGAWPEVLRGFCEAFQADASVLWFYDFLKREGGIWKELGLDPAFVRSYGRHFTGRNVWLRREQLLRTPGTVHAGAELYPEDQLAGDNFFKRWLEPQDLFHSLHAVAYREGREVLVHSLLRSPAANDFGTEAVAAYGTVVPHLCKSLEINRALTGVELARDLAEDALDNLSVGVILLDDRGQVLEANGRARAIAEANDGLIITPQGLRAATAREAAELRWLILGTHRAASTGRWSAGGALSISRPSGLRPFNLVVMPLRPTDRFLGKVKCAVAVFIVDPEQRDQISVDRLRRLYGLTKSEAKLAALLVSGRKLEEVADTLGVRPSTARSHLSSIFTKTGCTRQPELVRLLLTGPAQVCNGRPAA